MDRNQNEEKKSSSKTITTVILSAVVFIAVAFGAYFVIHNIFLSREIQAKALAEEQFAKEQALKEAEAVQEQEPEEPEPEEVIEEEEEEPEEEVVFEPVDPSEYIREENIVDYSVTAFVPAKRNYKLKWRDTVFSSLENLNQPQDAKINTLSYSKRRMKTTDDKEMEYEVYKDPDTGVFSKITAIENCGDYFELTDYYFDSGARLNYAAGYRQFVQVPFDISTDKVQSRYYIAEDTMVRYIYAGDAEAISYELSDYEEYSEGTKEQYDYLEKEIINRAYITYQVCSQTKELTHIHGYVLDEFNQPLSGVQIALLSVSEDGESEKRTAETKTDGDGEYDFTVEASEQRYNLSFKKESLEGQKIYNVKVPSGSGILYADTVYMGYTDNKEALYNMNFYVRDVFENTKVIAGAEIRLRSGIHNQNGELLTLGYLDENGSFQYGLCSGSYTAEIVAEGYETSCFTVIVKQDHQAVIGYTVPELSEGRYAAFVYWEKNPLDLDARLFSQYGKTVTRSVTESIGAITTENFILDNIGAQPYRLYVSDYIGCASGDNMSQNMSASGVYAKVYSSAGELASYEVPAGHAGVVWDALTIRDGQILPDGKYYYIYDSDFYWTAK